MSEENKPLFSVAVASYNNGKYLGELIESVLRQEYTNWELVIADDCSSDSSVSIIQEYQKKSSKIRLVRHKENMGAGAAFKSAIDASCGELLGLTGADDALLPETIMRFVDSHHKYPSASLIYSNFYYCGEELDISKAKLGFSKPIPPGTTAMSDSYISHYITFKKKYYKQTSGIPSYRKRAVDIELYLRLEEVGDLVYIDSPLYLYRFNKNGISQGQKNSILAYLAKIDALKQARERRLKKNFPLNISKKEIELLFEELMICLRYRQRLLHYFRHYPGSKWRGICLGLYTFVEMCFAFIHFTLLPKIKKKILGTDLCKMP